MLFQVWAPNADSVEIVFRERRKPLQCGVGGWWSIDVPVDPADRLAGVDYAFSINGGRPLPDPRSPFQPEGVDGFSRTVDHAAFPWTDERWQAPPLSSAVLYELHVGTFSREGTFEGAIAHLPHLVELGVKYVELMPIAEFKGDRGWGYDGVDLYAPHHSYGGPIGLKRLVDACHRHGLGVILDVVYNHLGPSGNYLPQFGPYFTDKHKTPWGSAVNFDGCHSDEVRRFFCDNAVMWLRDYHFDGLRLDAVHAIVDTSAIPFLEQLATEIDSLKAHLGRHLVLIAESDLNDPRVVRPWQMGGFGLDAQWSDDIHHAIHSVLTGERDGYYADFGTLADLATAMMQPYVYAGRHSSYRQRQHGRPPTGLSGSNFLAYSQNHDQLGNRAHGDRMTHLVNRDRAKIAAALTILSPFVPMLFQGEEWGASSPFQYFVDYHDDPELARAITAGRQQEFITFGWKPEDVPDPQDVATFERSKLDWDEVARPCSADMVAWYRQLLKLRRDVAGMTDGRLDMVSATADEDSRWLQVTRGPIRIIANFLASPQEFRLDFPARIRLCSKPAIELNRRGVRLPGDSVAVIETVCDLDSGEPLPDRADGSVNARDAIFTDGRLPEMARLPETELHVMALPATARLPVREREEQAVSQMKMPAGRGVAG